jgi:hypothetical protein
MRMPHRTQRWSYAITTARRKPRSRTACEYASPSSGRSRARRGGLELRVKLVVEPGAEHRVSQAVYRVDVRCVSQHFLHTRPRHQVPEALAAQMEEGHRQVATPVGRHDA